MDGWGGVQATADTDTSQDREAGGTEEGVLAWFLPADASQIRLLLLCVERKGVYGCAV